MSEQDSKLKAEPLSLAQRKAFEEILEVFQTPGWKRLRAQLIDNQSRAANVRNTQNLDFARGQLDVLDNLVNWPDLWQRLYDGAEAGEIEVAPEFGNDPRI